MPRTKAFNQDEVLEKAKTLFWEKGYNATSMQVLVSSLGINRASLYDTFGNKNQLFEMAIEKYISDYIQELADFLYHQLNVRQGLYLLFEKSVEEALRDEVSNGCFIVNTITEMANTSNSIKTKLIDHKEKTETIFYNYLQYGVNQGQISPYKDIKALASFIYSLQSGINVLTKVEKEKIALMQTINISLSVLD